MTLLQYSFGADWEEWSRELVFVPAKLGGLGFRSAELTADAAYAASWSATEEDVRRKQAAPSLATAEAETPHLTAAAAEAKRRLATQGVGLARSASGLVSQGSTTKQLVQRRVRDLRAGLPEDEKVLMRSHGGSAALALAAPCALPRAIPPLSARTSRKEK